LGAFLFILLAFQPFLIWRWQNVHPPLIRFLGDEVGQILIMGSLIWLSPLPWEWKSPSGKATISWAAAVRAFVTGEIVMFLITYVDSLFNRLSHMKPNSLGIYLLDLCLWGPAFFLVGLLISYQTRLESEREDMRGKVVEAQVRHLQGQLNPHVLFNALNSLAELLQEDPEQGEACVKSMASLLRRILDASEVDAHPLSEERALVEDYLSVESLRHGHRLRMEWDWDSALDQLPVLPLLLQPLVENALKHGISRTRRGGCLRIQARRDGATLHLQVANEGPAPGVVKNSRTGIGLKNLKSRLQLAYGDTARFTFDRRDEWTVAELALDIPRLQEHHDALKPRPSG
jgi:two-component sensor histidine kinase